MTAISSILTVGRMAQATALLGHNISLAKKKNKTAKDFIGVATTNLVGIPLLTTQAQLASGL